MKALLCSVFCCLLVWKTSNAQVSATPFTQSMDPYQVINGTVVDAPGEDDMFHSNLPIGFSFTYNGASTNKFGIGTNGFIAMDSLPHNTMWTINSGSIKQISVLQADLQNTNTGGSIEYVTVGTAPNRVCIIQWKDYSIFGVPYCHLNAQIRLFEGSGCIQLCYGYNAYSTMAGRTFYVGLIGNSISDFSMRTATTDWTNNNASATISGTGMYMNPLTNVPSGLVFSFGTCPPTGTAFSYLRGTVYNDLNGNGVRDSGEPGMPNILIHESVQNFYATTDTGGHYYLLFLDSTLTYSLSANAPTYWSQSSSPVSYSVQPLTQPATNLDFGLSATPNVHDVSIVCNAGNVPWPNAQVALFATYHNAGTVVEPGDSIFFIKDSLYGYVSATPAPALVSGDSIVWVYSNLQIGEFRNITLHLHSDTSLVAGDSLHSHWIIQPLSGDAAVANNTVNLNQGCMSSIDPNEKTVSPDGNILNNQLLSYTIHFQNTGTAPAANVFIADTLDASLDVATFKLTGYSHPVTYTIDGTGIVHFTFASINLPDSNTNSLGSHGLVSYDIKPKSALAGGTKIHNKASIVFDYNAPVHTNTTENIIVENIPATLEHYSTNWAVQLYPNPAEETLYIKTAKGFKHASVRLYDISGRVVLSKTFATSQDIQIDLHNVHSGTYLLVLQDGSNLLRKKVVRQ